MGIKLNLLQYSLLISFELLSQTCLFRIVVALCIALRLSCILKHIIVMAGFNNQFEKYETMHVVQKATISDDLIASIFTASSSVTA